MPRLLGNDRNGSRMGIIVPSSNTVLEPDCARLVGPGVAAHFARLGGYDVDAIPDAALMRQLAMSSIEDPLSLLLAARVDVIGYGCASASFSCGWLFDQRLGREIEAQAGVAAVTTAGAMVAAIKALGARQIGFTSPYVAELNRAAVAFFAGAGIQVVNCADLATDLSSIEQGRLAPRDAFDLGLATDHPEAEAIVIGCTDLRAVEIIGDLGKELGKPVVTSNQSLVSACLARIDGSGC